KTVTFFAHPSSAPKLKRPAEPIGGPKKVLTMGGTEIDILFLGRAHTGGDLEVYLPKEKILFMSEVFVNRIFPSMANGFPTEWIATLKKIEALHADTLVAAHNLTESAGMPQDAEPTFRGALERV